eukprot:snap_masked-scaffold_3-processed-gene-3.37-mRNA-1 protein AED:1.00 eAED:1.00 QI:0/0/0/0/1/1/2/0/261
MKTINTLDKKKRREAGLIRNTSLDESFPVPTYINPTAVYSSSQAGFKKVAEKNLRVLDAKLTRNENQLSKAKRKLLELRSKHLTGRKENQIALLEEQQKRKISQKRQQEEAKKDEELQGKRLKKLGITSRHTHLTRSIEHANKKNELRQTKKDNLEASKNFAGIYDEDMAHRSYERRAKQLQKLKEYDVENLLEAEAALEKKRKDKMKRRAKNKYERTLRGQDGNTLSAINIKNDQWNEKLERSYGKYTETTKVNLERGTA